MSDKIPKKYFGSLSTRKRAARKREILKRRNQSSNYGEWETDKGVKTRKSVYTSRYEKMYGSKKQKRGQSSRKKS